MSRLTERVENFNKAFNMFEWTYGLYIKDKNNVAYRLAVTQAFEINFELGWKVMKDYLTQKGITTTTQKNLLKKLLVRIYCQMLKFGLI